MQAMLLERAGVPLKLAEIAVPAPGPGQILIKVTACGVCRTDLHIFDGELDRPKLPLVLGHEIVGRIETLGEGVEGFAPGDRVGVPWLGWTDGTCAYCRAGEENLCDDPRFTGYQIDGGYAEYTVADARYAFTLRSWMKDHRIDVFDSRSLESYRAQMRDPARVHAMCEDYRAGASIDRRLDLSDKARDAKITSPLLFVWSSLGFPAATGDPLSFWKAWTHELSGAQIQAGHFIPEENPHALLAAAVPFLKDADP
ncbi:MAG: alcohol dehydrogenase catalytic domain-containing protein [Methyloceanibacter sp.]